MFDSLFGFGQNLFKPQRLIPCLCTLCASRLNRTDQANLCDYCRLSLPHLSAPFCRCCALPLHSRAELCGHCLRKHPAFTLALIPFRYEFPLDRLLQGFKYQRHLYQGLALANLQLAYLQATLADNQTLRPDALVPVPMHWRRRWQRGFNQAEELARHLGKGLQLPLVQAITHNGRSHSQQGLSRDERLGNLKRAFGLKPNCSRLIKGKHLALVDDVVTTGATAACLSQLLIKAGAARVDIWALARTPAPGFNT